MPVPEATKPWAGFPRTPGVHLEARAPARPRERRTEEGREEGTNTPRPWLARSQWQELTQPEQRLRGQDPAPRFRLPALEQTEAGAPK